jgi:hypothetical protein
MTDPPSRQGGRPKKNKDHNSQHIGLKNLVMSPRMGSTPTRTGWLTVSRNVTLTLTSAYSSVMTEAVRTSETSVDIHFTRQYNPEDSSEHHTRRRENLKSHIVNLHGEATLRCIRRFESLRIKKAKRLCSLSFLLRCRDQGTIPRFLQFHHYIHSEAAERIYRRTSFTHPWWWRQYAPLKRRSTIYLHGSTTQKTALNIV